MNENILEILEKVGWQQAYSEHGSQVRTDVSGENLKADVVSWDGELLTISSEVFDRHTAGPKVSIACRMSGEALEILKSTVDGVDVSLDDAILAYREQTKDQGPASFQSTGVLAPRTKSGYLAL